MGVSVTITPIMQPKRTAPDTPGHPAMRLCKPLLREARNDRTRTLTPFKGANRNAIVR